MAEGGDLGCAHGAPRAKMNTTESGAFLEGGTTQPRGKGQLVRQGGIQGEGE